MKSVSFGVVLLSMGLMIAVTSAAGQQQPGPLLATDNTGDHAIGFFEDHSADSGQKDGFMLSDTPGTGSR